MNTPRRGHGVIYVDEQFLVVGGGGLYNNENCQLTQGEVTCTKQSTSLNNYAFYPELYLVESDFDQNC